MASTALPSTVDGASSAEIMIPPQGLRDSRHACQAPYASATTASGHAAMRGISDASTAKDAAAASTSNVPISSRDGRHSRRQAADVLDERVECGIGCGVMAEEPAPELIVLAVQQT